MTFDVSPRAVAARVSRHSVWTDPVVWAAAIQDLYPGVPLGSHLLFLALQDSLIDKSEFSALSAGLHSLGLTAE